MSKKYQVIISGANKTLHNKAQVSAALAKLLNISPDKALIYLSKERIFKKDLEKAKADAISKKLTSIGVISTIVTQSPPEPVESFSDLSLEPLQNATEPEPDTFGGLSLAPLESESEPKATTKQKKPIDLINQSSNLTVNENAASRDILRGTDPSTKEHHHSEVDHSRYVRSSKNIGLLGIELFGDITIFRFIIGIGIAVLCALIWSKLAVSRVDGFFHLNWMALAIGAIIGIAIMFTGSGTVGSGMFCAILTIAACMWGKQMMMIGTVEKTAQKLYTERIDELEKDASEVEALVDKLGKKMDTKTFKENYAKLMRKLGKPLPRVFYSLGDDEIRKVQLNLKKQIPKMNKFLKMAKEAELAEINAQHENFDAQDMLTYHGKKSIFDPMFLMYMSIGAIIAFRFGYRIN